MCILKKIIFVFVFISVRNICFGQTTPSSNVTPTIVAISNNKLMVDSNNSLFNKEKTNIETYNLLQKQKPSLITCSDGTVTITRPNKCPQIETH